jgi:hypothetical protein
MNGAKEAVADYPALRRGFGFKLKKHSRILNEFVAFLEEQGALHISSQLALRWATEPQSIRRTPPCEYGDDRAVVLAFDGFQIRSPQKLLHLFGAEPVPERTPTLFAPFTLRMRAANSGLNRAVSAASYARRRTAEPKVDRG